MVERQRSFQDHFLRNTHAVHAFKWPQHQTIPFFGNNVLFISPYHSGEVLVHSPVPEHFQGLNEKKKIKKITVPPTIQRIDRFKIRIIACNIHNDVKEFFSTSSLPLVRRPYAYPTMHTEHGVNLYSQKKVTRHSSNFNCLKSAWATVSSTKHRCIEKRCCFWLCKFSSIEYCHPLQKFHALAKSELTA